MSPRECAELTGCSLQTAYLRCWLGQVPCKQILGKWVIELSREEIAAARGGVSMSRPTSNLISMKNMLDNGNRSSKLVSPFRSLFSANSFSTRF